MEREVVLERLVAVVVGRFEALRELCRVPTRERGLRTCENALSMVARMSSEDVVARWGEWLALYEAGGGDVT